jgi:hypothetical protein
MQGDVRKWIKYITKIVDELNKKQYEQERQQIEELGESINFTRKVIFQQHNSTDEDKAMETALERYFEEYKNDKNKRYENNKNKGYDINDDDRDCKNTMKLAVVLYELKEKEPDNYSEFIKKFT